MTIDNLNREIALKQIVKLIERQEQLDSPHDSEYGMGWQSGRETLANELRIILEVNSVSLD